MVFFCRCHFFKIKLSLNDKELHTHNKRRRWKCKGESVKLRRWGSDSKYKCSFAFTLSTSHLYTWAPSPSQLHTFVFRTLHCRVFDRPKGKVHWLNCPQQSTIHIFLYLSFSCSQHILCYALEIIYAHILWKNIDVQCTKTYLWYWNNGEEEVLQDALLWRLCNHTAEVLLINNSMQAGTRKIEPSLHTQWTEWSQTERKLQREHIVIYASM